MPFLAIPFIIDAAAVSLVSAGAYYEKDNIHQGLSILGNGIITGLQNGGSFASDVINGAPNQTLPDNLNGVRIRPPVEQNATSSISSRSRTAPNPSSFVTPRVIFVPPNSSALAEQTAQAIKRQQETQANIQRMEAQIVEDNRQTISTRILTARQDTNSLLMQQGSLPAQTVDALQQLVLDRVLRLQAEQAHKISPFSQAQTTVQDAASLIVNTFNPARRDIMILALQAFQKKHGLTITPFMSPQDPSLQSNGPGRGANLFPDAKPTIPNNTAQPNNIDPSLGNPNSGITANIRVSSKPSGAYRTLIHPRQVQGLEPIVAMASSGNTSADGLEQVLGGYIKNMPTDKTIYINFELEIAASYKKAKALRDRYFPGMVLSRGDTTRINGIRYQLYRCIETKNGKAVIPPLTPGQTTRAEDTKHLLTATSDGYGYYDPITGNIYVHLESFKYPGSNTAPIELLDQQAQEIANTMGRAVRSAQESPTIYSGWVTINGETYNTYGTRATVEPTVANTSAYSEGNSMKETVLKVEAALENLKSAIQQRKSEGKQPTVKQTRELKELTASLSRAKASANIQENQLRLDQAGNRQNNGSGSRRDHNPSRDAGKSVRPQ